MQDFKKLKVWQKAHLLAVAVYQTTETFPRDEIFGLTSQIRRACISIPANIAEGCGREGSAELKRFLQIALGSTTELEYHLLLSKELKILSDTKYEQLDSQVGEIRRMLIVLTQKLKNC
jgi:four helix bundle protein